MNNLIKTIKFRFSNAFPRKSKYNIKNEKISINLCKNTNKKEIKSNLKPLRETISNITAEFKEKLEVLKLNRDYEGINKLYKSYGEEIRKYEIQIELIYENKLYEKSLDAKYARKIEDLSMNHIIECFPNYFRLDKGFGSNKFSNRTIEVNEEDDDEFIGLETAKAELRHKQLELKASNLFLNLNENDPHKAMDSLYSSKYKDNITDYLVQPINKEIKEFDKNVQINQNFIEGLEDVLPGTIDNSLVFDKEANFLEENEEGQLKKGYIKSKVKSDESIKYNKI